ncbi:MAG: sarcosine oxidase subunit delta [Proteobacteria bacterium]|nr:sarcosine oxidase subunit delta [Pseudomonadota bacterium]
MILIRCPHCGERDQTEFSYIGDGTLTRPPDDPAVPLERWYDYVYLRDNPRGAHSELWQHGQGCRAFVLVRRDTVTHAIEWTGLPHPSAGGGKP